MDTNIFTCMEARGIITESQRMRMTQLASTLPETDNDLLKTIAAILLMGGEESYHGTPIGVEALTSTDTVTVEALTVPTGATRAIISIHGNNIIFRTDGGTPAPNVGHVGEINANISIGSLEDFKFVSQSTTDAFIFVSYF